MRGRLIWISCDHPEGCDNCYEEHGAFTFAQLRARAAKHGWMSWTNDEDYCPDHRDEGQRRLTGQEG